MSITQERLKVDEFWSTADLSLAGVIAIYYPLEAVDKTQDPFKAQFIFKRDASLDKLVEAYWKNELKVDPQIYFQRLKVIKARLYSER